MRILFLLFFILGVFSPEVRAASVLPLSLDQLAQQAGTIFVGRCQGVETSLDEQGLPSTYARFEVEQGLKGTEGGVTLLIKQYGAVRAPLHVGEGESVIVSPKTLTLAGGSYRPGAEYLLFLYPESELGFTSPVGAGQGRFEISQKTSTAALAVNPLGNRFLKTLGDEPAPLEDMVREIRKRVER